jgi:hypothetical protein
MKDLSSGPPVKDRDPVSANGHAVNVASLRLPLATRQRKPGYIALAVILIIGLAVAFGWFYKSSGAKIPVVVVIAPVAAGHPVLRQDLSTIDVSGGVVAVGGDHMDSVVGEVATVDLLPNTLLQRSMVTSADTLPVGQAQVGVALKGGQVPAEGLSPGDSVEIVALPDKGAAGAAQSASVLVASAKVFAAVVDPAQVGGLLVTVTVPAADAVRVAQASGTGLVALVKVRS